MKESAILDRKPRAEIAVIPGSDKLSNKQLSKISATEPIKIGKDIAKSVALTGATVGSGALTTVAFGTACIASSGLAIGSALFMGWYLFFATLILIPFTCDANKQTKLHLQLKRTNIDGIHAYRMSLDQFDTLKTQLSSVWDRVENELAERPLESLGTQLHIALGDYVSESNIVQCEIEELERTAKSIPNGEFRLRKQLSDLRKARRIEAEKAAEAIKEAFKIHDDAVVEAAQISTRSLLESRGITVDE